MLLLILIIIDKNTNSQKKYKTYTKCISMAKI